LRVAEALIAIDNGGFAGIQPRRTAQKIVNEQRYVHRAPKWMLAATPVVAATKPFCSITRKFQPARVKGSMVSR
jgi:hypothetical protein